MSTQRLSNISQEILSDSKSEYSEDDLYDPDSIERMKDVLDEVYRVGLMVRQSTYLQCPFCHPA